MHDIRALVAYLITTLSKYRGDLLNPIFLLYHTCQEKSICHGLAQSVILEIHMAKLARTDILKLAKLARLRLSDAEVDKFQEEISGILGYVDMLKNVDTGNLKPTYQVSGLVNVTRKDEVKDYGTTQLELLKNAPDTEKAYLKVKRMIG